MNEDYCIYIGYSIDQFVGTDIICVRDEIGVNNEFGGYGASEDRGLRVYFDKDLICCKIAIDFNGHNSHDFCGLNNGSRLCDVGSKFGQLDESGWQAVLSNWYIPEKVVAYIHNGNRVEVIAGMLTKRIRRVWIEKFA